MLPYFSHRLHDRIDTVTQARPNTWLKVPWTKVRSLVVDISNCL